MVGSQEVSRDSHPMSPTQSFPGPATPLTCRTPDKLPASGISNVRAIVVNWFVTAHYAWSRRRLSEGSYCKGMTERERVKGMWGVVD